MSDCQPTDTSASYSFTFWLYYDEGRSYCSCRVRSAILVPFLFDYEDNLTTDQLQAIKNEACVEYPVKSWCLHAREPWFTDGEEAAIPRPYIQFV